VHVRREHGDERGDQEQPGGAPRARVHRAERAGDLGHAARVDELAVGGQVRRHDPHVPARLEEVHDAGERHHRPREEARHSLAHAPHPNER
jgi:hypothetical protein